MSNLQANVNLDPKIVGSVTNPRSGDSAYQVALKNGFVGTEKEWLASLKGEKGDTYTITKSDYDEIADVVEYNIQPQLNEMRDTTEHAEAIAKGKATGYVFDTLEDLDIWLQNSENTSKLVLGDNLYIKATDVPDYWWDGTTKQQLETQKVDLTNYMTEEEYLYHFDWHVKRSLLDKKFPWSQEESLQAGINYQLFGLGSTCKNISNSDLDSACGVLGGFYMGSNLKNAPNNSTDWFYILHMAHDENYQKQLAFGVLNNSFNMRTKIETAWTGWT